MRLILVLFLTTPIIATQFTTSLGDTYPYNISAITTDTAGNTYIVGSRQIAVGAQPSSDLFVSKLDPNGKLLFTDKFGGKGIDTGTAIAIDPTGNIYIAGTTTSPDFPLSHALQTTLYPGATGSGFIMKLSGDGTNILYSTFFGGTLGQSAISSLATDASGNLYLTGYTLASDFPHTAGMPFGTIQQSPATSGAIIASISAAGDKILYSGVIAMPNPCTTSCISLGGVQWNGVGIALDAAGNAYIAGNDPSAINLPTTSGTLSPKGIGAFVAKIAAGGKGLSYLTYLGAGEIGNDPFYSADNTVYGIAVDAAGNAYLAGQTDDPNFPVTSGSYQTTQSSSSAQGGFIAKLNPTGSAIVWATYLNGASPQSIAIDSTGDIWSTGTTGNSPFPNTNGWSTGTAFLAELNSTGSKLTYSALYPTATVGQSVAVDTSGVVHFAGSAGFVSTISPSVAQTLTIFDFQNAAGGNVTARISPAEVIAIYGPGIGPTTAMSATPTNGFYPTTLAGVQVTINGVNIPLLYVSANQINAVVPMEATPNSACTVHVTNGTSVSPDYAVWIVASTPQAFVPVVNQDGTINSKSNPAHGNSIVFYYGTGWQSSFAPLGDGQVDTGPLDACLGACQANASYFPYTPCVGFCFARPAQSSTPITISAKVLYGGAAPEIVAGVTQFNVQFGAVPTTSGTNLFNVNISSGSNSISQTVWIAP